MDAVFDDAAPAAPDLGASHGAPVLTDDDADAFDPFFNVDAEPSADLAADAPVEGGSAPVEPTTDMGGLVATGDTYAVVESVPGAPDPASEVLEADAADDGSDSDEGAGRE
jgi:hypothetical protein